MYIIWYLIDIEHREFLYMYGFCVPIEQCYIQFLICARDNHMFILVLLKKLWVPQWRVTEDHVIAMQLECLTLIRQAQPPIYILGLVWLRDASSIGHQS